MKSFQTAFLFSLTLLFTHTASAHTNYGGVARDLGPSAGSTPGIITGASVGTPYFKTINTQSVTSNFGWAHGTEAAFGDAHDIRAFRFTLAEAGWATIQATTAARGSGLAGLLPAFSLYSGLLHTTTGSDYDTAPVTQTYLATLGNPQPRRGAFDALHTWKIGNDAGELSTLTYVGNAADGTSANFGSAAGINGDGTADGNVSGSWWLPAGDYTLIVGGGSINGADATGTYGVDVSLTVIPEPSAALLGAVAGLGLVLRRKRP
ncbi:MAG: hypothetical protein EOP88_06330 [Verrucomicrobiaceae bacterium]|nr:MAG: hypothetical protein EOP88_06330 [Verrucomicrobiaceae bacterium]